MTADDRRPPLPPHPDLDTLADLHAGALDPAAAERVRAHVSGCAECARVLAALDGVGAERRALPAPPLPASVAARLDTTLADLRRTAPTRAGDVAREERRAREWAESAQLADRRAARDRRRQRLGRALGSVAAAVAVLAAGASLTAIVRSGGNQSDSGGSAASAPVDSDTRAESGGPASLAVPSYDRGTLRADLPRIAQRSAVDIITGRDDTGVAGVMADAGRRTACANTIRGTAGALEAVQRIRYEGRMAYVFVFADGGRRTAYVVSDDCGTSPALPAAVLDTVS